MEHTPSLTSRYSISTARWHRQLLAAFAVMSVLPLLTFAYFVMSRWVPGVTNAAVTWALIGLNVVLALAGLLMLRRKFGSLMRFVHFVESVAKGHRAQPLAIEDGPEIVTIARSVQTIVERLHQDREKLSALSDELGRTVDERTSELRRANDDLRRELAERQRAQEQLRQAQKMEAIGTLAGGIAHDFNNMLTAISGFAALALRKVDGLPEVRDYMIEVQKAADRAAFLTRQLLAVSRRQVLQTRMLDVNELVQNMGGMLGRLIGENITFVTTLDPKLDPVNADRNQIEQLLMNLVVNACEAMPRGGRLEVTTSNVAVADENLGEYPDVRPGRYVCMSVADTGVGIDDETRSRLFEPFFTRKEHGTGLGLAVANGVVRQHNGWINVESSPGKGSTFRVFIPSVRGTVSTDDTRPAPVKMLRGNSERLLLVEDEESVRKCLARALTESGYDVICASSVAEGREVFRLEKDRLKIVFTDVVLPDGTGLDLVDDILKQKPDMPVVFNSGYSDERSERFIVEEVGFPFLPKPSPLSEVLKAIREALTTPRVRRPLGPKPGSSG